MQNRSLSESSARLSLREGLARSVRDHGVSETFDRSGLFPSIDRREFTQRSQRILILSDDIKFCALVRSFLQNSNLSVFACTTARRAEFTFLNRCELDLWVIDVQALGMEAISFAARVSEMSPETPILIVEGAKPGERVARGFLKSEWKTIRRPIKLTDILTKIHRLLGTGTVLANRAI
jgi:DNA-binding NtrC family response regulator